MPIYEYQCEQCGKIVEKWQKVSDPPLTECENCKGPMRKLVSQTSFQLKGSGWYVTDYCNRKSPEKSSSSASSKSSKSSKKASSSKSKKD